jgi:D-arabinose 1-dehydrogenase-like Zn-dependent alcohol dehydrogenase
VGGVHALHFLRLTQLQACQEILIVAACGCIGTAAITRRITDKRVITKLARVTEADLQTLCKQIGEKSLEASIDTTYKLEEVVEAHRYIDAGNKKGHVAFVLDAAAEQQTKDQ